MPPAAVREKEGSDLGAPQTPAGGLRPPAPPAEEVELFRYRAYAACGGEGEGGK